MKCYNHPDSDAVAICKNCQKGLCMDCAVEVGNGIACKGTCEQAVEGINEIINRSMGSHNKIQSNNSKSHYTSAIFSLLCGCAFTFFGIFSLIVEQETVFSIPQIVFGIIFLFAGALYISTGKRASRLFEKDN